MTLNKKHLYSFKIKCDKCKNIYNMKFELYEYVDPEWLIKSVPIKNICKKCSVKLEVKNMIKDIILKKFGAESMILDGKSNISIDRNIRWHTIDRGI